ncbi:MAG: LysE family transporter [Acidobacteria bacterium]|nr:LysE family transporter [Acidobacteriota bacterium]
MLEYVLLGIGFAFSAAIQPGPLQAFLLSRVVATGWKRTLPASLSPLLSDIPIAVLVLLVLGRLPAMAQLWLRAAGGCLLIYFAWSAFRQLRRSSQPSSADFGSAPRTLLQAALVNVLNPNPYLGWALVLGPAVATAWHHYPASAVALIVAFYGTMVATLAGFVFLVGTARFLSARVQRVLVGFSALSLAALGVYQLVVSIPRL